VINNERLTLVEICTEDDGRQVKSFHAYSVPAVGEDINWGSKYRVKVMERDWVIDTADNPSGNLRCVLICKKVVWPRARKGEPDGQ
jgi:hypothetical protein